MTPVSAKDPPGRATPLPIEGGFVRGRASARASAIPDDNLFVVPAGIYGPAVADGYWAVPPPLPQGTHELRFRAHAVLGPPIFPPDTVIEQDAIYHLEAADPAPIE